MNKEVKQYLDGLVEDAYAVKSVENTDALRIALEYFRRKGYPVKRYEGIYKRLCEE